MDHSLEVKYQHQAIMLANRVKKRYRYFRKVFGGQNIEVFRLYDWDIPEIRAVVDWYAGHLVMGEYTRRQSTAKWLPMMGKAVAEALKVPSEKLHLKERFYGSSDGKRYRRLDYTNKMFVVYERDLKFYVNPWDYVDTGLFADHRNTRQMIRQMAHGKDFLNLFCYSGSFSCYAAKGGARTTISVDRSRTAVNWVRKNMSLNNIDLRNHQIIQIHAFDYLAKAKRENLRFDLAVVDPPSFYTIRNRDVSFDIAQAHPSLLNAVATVMRKGAVIFFSTNHQNFIPLMNALRVASVKEITDQTIPADYVRKRKMIHRCWQITV